MTEEESWAADKAEFVAHLDDPAYPVGGLGTSPLAAQFTELARKLLDAGSVAEVLSRIVHATLRVIPEADLVSVTLRSRDGKFHTPVESDPVAAELDELQYRVGHGPCLDSARESGPAYARSGDLATDPAWPDFGPAAAEHGYASVVATALLPPAGSQQLSGAINVYSRRGNAFTDTDRDILLLLATHASLALATTQAVELAALEEAQLRRALDSRDVIGQAKGVLMHRRRISADDAFDLLRRTSQQLNVKVAELARTLAARHGELDSGKR